MTMSKKQIITLEWLNTTTGTKFLEKNAHALVFIISDNGIWRQESRGYTDSFESGGVYRLKEAYLNTRHCGPEKSVRYKLIPATELLSMINRANSRLSHLIEKLQP